MVNNVNIGSFFASIELESVSAAERTDGNLNKVIFFPRERYVVDIKNCLTDILIWVLRLRFFTKYKECNWVILNYYGKHLFNSFIIYLA